MLVIHQLKGFPKPLCCLITLMLLGAALVAPAKGQDSTKDPRLESARKPDSREPGSPINVNPLTGLGTAVVQGTVQSAGCALLGQDPRYIRSSSEKVLNRSLHAILFGTITYNNEGKKRPALATLSSYYASSVIATSWMPDRYTSLGDGVRDANRQVVLSCLVNEIQEFWPEITKLLPHKIP